MRNRVSYSTRVVIVVPIPRLSCSVSVRWKMAPFAARFDVRIRSATWSSERPFRDPSSRATKRTAWRSEEHTSELQSPCNLVCRLLLEKKKKHTYKTVIVQHHTDCKS